ncbi:MAG TPA: YtxH domain-containing protein [Pseudoneobacillus sp.]|nr:YtxH domain-containing protein [Pseudoneobacillus sp.]
MANHEKRSDTLNERRNEDSSTSSKDFIIGAILGGVVGAAAALFLAPKTGKDFRGSLNDQAAIWKNKSEQMREVAKDKGSNLVSIAKEKTSTLTKALNSTDELTYKVSKIGVKDGQNSKIETNMTLEDEIHKKLQDAAKALEEEEQKIKS